MKDMGDALMGIGIASGEHRATEAAQNALNSPLLEGVSIHGAQGLLVNISGGSSMTMHEISEAISIIEESAGNEVNLIQGIVYDEALEDKIMITVVATGFKRNSYAIPTIINKVEAPSIPSVSQIQASAPILKTVQTIIPEPSKVDVQTETEPSAPVLFTMNPEKIREVKPMQQPSFIRRSDPNTMRQSQGGSIRINSVSDLPSAAKATGQPIVIRDPKSSVVEKPAFLRKIMD